MLQYSHLEKGGVIMAFKLNHLHLKTPDPQQTAQWYVNNLGAKIVSETANGGFRIDLHGLPLNVTKFIDSQTHDQVYGIEHIAIDTDDIDGTVEHLKASGARILEETQVGGGRRVCFFEGPQGVCLEVLEIPK
jgi:catechol 2,3-dioxygenase-like lactoylglutathione lyase family enzyme